MTLVNLQFDADELDTVALELGATEEAFDKAVAAACRKMAEWLKAQSVKGLAHELGIRQKVIRQRLRTFRMQRAGPGGEYKLFYGLDPIGYIRLGTPRKTAKGVRVGKFFIKEGFVAKDKGAHVRVFKRRGRARLPIEVQKLDIEPKAAPWIEDKLLGTADFEAQFFKFLEHELTWRTATKP